MNYKNAVVLAVCKRLIGWILLITGMLSTLVSILKFLSLHIDNGSMAAAFLADPYKQLYIFVYGKTDFLSFFWNNSPVPDLGSLTSTNSLYFFAVYIMIFIGSAVKNSGAKLSSRLFKTGEQIEDQLMEDQIKGVTSRSRAEIRNTLSIPDYSIFRQLLWELIPFIITSGLMFGFYKMFGF